MCKHEYEIEKSDGPSSKDIWPVWGANVNHSSSKSCNCPQMLYDQRGAATQLIRWEKFQWLQSAFRIEKEAVPKKWHVSPSQSVAVRT